MADLTADSERGPIKTVKHPFSVARAINRAARLAPPEYDAFVLFGADHVPDSAVLDHAQAMLGQYEWLPLYRRIAYASEQSTAEWLRTKPIDLIGTWFKEPQLCPGVLAVRRELFERVGGMDERYEGWGYEDNAFYETLCRAAAPGPVTSAVLRELWHPRDHRDLNSPNRALYLGGSRG
ncbi:galactosyltransferase-related protein [Amycolatopsis thailandensis]|uniref:galactosyltransferase-related protein n=1 Tax=Amycolatopsis thailandensis TaxID=589330 RepID=UPI003651AB5F